MQEPGNASPQAAQRFEYGKLLRRRKNARPQETPAPQIQSKPPERKSPALLSEQRKRSTDPDATRIRYEKNLSRIVGDACSRWLAIHEGKTKRSGVQ
jgi:hypothetical protein